MTEYYNSIMWCLPSVVLAVLAWACWAVPEVQSAALTTLLEPHSGKSCYYAWVDQSGEKVGFYFAVQSGGSFDIDYTVLDPNDKVVVSGERERQVDIIFTGNTVGEYTFCFSNDMSSFSEKLVDFDITVESEPRLDLPITPTSLLQDHSVPLEESITTVADKLTAITRTQRYFRLRENRNSDTVQSTQNKIFWYSVIESSTMIGISAAQVYIVRNLFERGSTKRYRV